MSQFEYVSVAVALVYSFAIARLLGGLPHTSARDRGAPVALVWNAVMILNALASWWILWRFNDIAWNPLAFAWIVGTPAFIYLRAAILITDNPSQVDSWEAHFFQVRKRFFGIALVQAVHSALQPWVVGAFPWFEFAPVHLGTLPLVVISLIGILSRSRRVHLALGALALAMILLFLFLTPSEIAPAA